MSKATDGESMPSLSVYMSMCAMCADDLATWPGLAWPAARPGSPEQRVDGGDSDHRQWPLATLAGGSANR
jgi:hypothetical protein